MSEWQPIESAPFNETMVMLKEQDGNEYKGYYHLSNMYWGTGGDRWLTEDGKRRLFPTAWKPLSKPPKSVETTKEVL
jgi:hypothetical protein